MDPAWIGVIGAAAGASATGLVDLGKVITEHVFKQRAANAEREQQEADRRHKVAADLLSDRRATIADWREKLRRARIEYDRTQSGSGDPWGDEANVVGDEWFEELRPHLPMTGEAARFRTATRVVCDGDTVVLLSLEIGRIEQQWLDEAKGSGTRPSG